MTDLANPSASGTEDVRGLATAVSIVGAAPTNDRVFINALDGDDIVDASGVAAGTAALTIDLGNGDDVDIGGAGDDTILAVAGDLWLATHETSGGLTRPPDVWSGSWSHVRPGSGPKRVGAQGVG